MNDHQAEIHQEEYAAHTNEDQSTQHQDPNLFGPSSGGIRIIHLRWSSVIQPHHLELKNI